MKNTQKIFTKIGVHYDEDQFVKIKYVDVDVINKQWQVCLHCSHLITEDYYTNIVNCFKDYYAKEVKVMIVLELENSKLSEQSANVLQGHYKRMIREDEMLRQASTSMNLRIDVDAINIEVSSSFDEARIDKVIQLLEPKLKTIGITNFHFTTSISATEKQREVEKRIETQLKDAQIKKTAIKKTNIKLFGEDILDKKVQTIAQVLDPNNLLIN